MAFLTDVSASRHIRLRRRIANGSIEPAHLGRLKQACEIGAALAMIAAIMTALALLELWVWVPTLPK